MELTGGTEKCDYWDMHPTLISQYISKALEKAAYEKDENGIIVASVPGVSGFFSQGKTVEEARDNLQDAIEGNILVALQMGFQIPEIDGLSIQRVETGEETKEYA